MLIFLDFTGFSVFPIFYCFTIFSVYLGIKSHIFCFKSCKKVVKWTPFCCFTTFYNSAVTYLFHLFLHIFKVNMRIHIQRNTDIAVPHDLL